MATDPSNPTMPIVEKEGKLYADPLHSGGTYLVPQYELPSPGDLKGFLPLLKDFQQRFLHFVDRGYTLNKAHPKMIDSYIEREREALKGDMPEDVRQLTMRWLKTALINRSMRNAVTHVEERMQEPEAIDQEKLNMLSRSIRQDTIEALQIPVGLRGKRGYVDDDGVLAEMLGEPQKLFLASLPTSPPDAMDAFNQTRCTKIAQAMECMDEVLHTVSAIVEKYPEFEQPMKKMVKHAKVKIGLQHGRPGYFEADKDYINARDHIHSLISGRQESILQREAALPAPLKRKGTGEMRNIISEMHGMAVIKDATDLVYDMAVTRDPRHKGLEWLKMQVKALDMLKGRGVA